MRVPRTLSIYVLREVLQYAGIGLLSVGSILMTQNLLRELSDLSGLGFETRDVVAVFSCLGLILSAYAIPVAFLFGVLVAVGRLSADSEVVAMRALGVSLGQFFAPFLALAILFSATTAVLLYDVEPASRRRLRAVVSDIASRGGIIQPGRFNELDRHGHRLVFVEDRTDDNRLSRVVISDRTNPDKPFLVVAETGQFKMDPVSATAHLELENGDIHFDPGESEARYQRIAFKTFDYAFDMSNVIGAGFGSFRPHEMSSRDIRDVLAYFEANGEPPPVVRVRTSEKYEVQLQRRYALPMAPILFALVGVPLGLRRARGARSKGVLICALLVFGYYALLSAGVYLAERHVVPAWLGLWIPNGVFVLVGGALLARARRAES